jgi:hypothetical protein
VAIVGIVAIEIDNQQERLHVDCAAPAAETQEYIKIVYPIYYNSHFVRSGVTFGFIAAHKLRRR